MFTLWFHLQQLWFFVTSITYFLISVNISFDLFCYFCFCVSFKLSWVRGYLYLSCNCNLTELPECISALNEQLQFKNEIHFTVFIDDYIDIICYPLHIAMFYLRFYFQSPWIIVKNFQITINIPYYLFSYFCFRVSFLCFHTKSKDRSGTQQRAANEFIRQHWKYARFFV